MKTLTFLAFTTAALLSSSAADEVRIAGADSMLQLVGALSESALQNGESFRVKASGGGSGVGFSALANESCDIAASSRQIKPAEIAKIETARGNKPAEIVLCLEALVIVVADGNSQESISLPELRDIYSEKATINDWTQLQDAAFKGKIEMFGFSKTSGTYAYFSESVLGGMTVKQRAFEVDGAKEMIASVSGLQEGIGYIPLGNMKAAGIKSLSLSPKKGEPAVEPTEENIRTGKYPLSRKLYLYTAGEQTPGSQAFLKFIASPAGRKALEEKGFIPSAE